jgi:hypothetical protein
MRWTNSRPAPVRAPRCRRDRIGSRVAQSASSLPITKSLRWAVMRAAKVPSQKQDIEVNLMAIVFPGRVISLMEKELLAIELGIVTFELGIVTSELGIVTSELGIVTSGLGIVTSEAGIVTSELGIVTSELGIVTSVAGHRYVLAGHRYVLAGHRCVRAGHRSVRNLDVYLHARDRCRPHSTQLTWHAYERHPPTHTTFWQTLHYGSMVTATVDVPRRRLYPPFPNVHV